MISGEAAIRCVGTDYGGTLTSPAAAVNPAFGCCPVTHDAAQTLHLIHERGLMLILGSDTLPHQDRRRALRQAGVEHLFTRVLTSDDLGYDKRDPRFFTTLVTAAGCRRDQVLFVGNNPETDVQAPLRCGLRAALLWQHEQPPQGLPDGAHLIGVITALPALLDTLMRPTRGRLRWR